MKFRKKPVVVEAVQWTGSNLYQIASFGDAVTSVISSPAGDRLRISTLEGDMTAKKGDWIIKGVRGELYPCRGDIFEETYEEVGD